MQQWNERKRKLFKPSHLQKAWERLKQPNWLSNISATNGFAKMPHTETSFSQAIFQMFENNEEGDYCMLDFDGNFNPIIAPIHPD